MLGPYYVGDVPATPMILDVVGDRGKTLSLSAYTGVELIIIDPRGNPIDLSSGFVAITSPSNGRVQFDWPTTSIFVYPGTYSFQLLLTSSSARAHTIKDVFTVERTLREI